MHKTRWLVLGLVGFLTPTLARAEIKLNSLFTDNMVLQREVECPIWGTADAGDELTYDIQHPTKDGLMRGSIATADKDGKFKGKLPKLDVGGPYTITVTSKKTQKNVVLKNVLVGEVWIASGQSNMQWAISQSADPEATIKNSTNPNLRLYYVPRVAKPTPQTSVDAKWTECNPMTSPGFSAVAYHFGQALQAHLKVPVGLIHTSWGGTPAQAWTSREALLAEPSLKYYVEDLDKAIRSYDPAKAKKAYEEALAKWKVAAEQAKKDGKPAPKQPPMPKEPGVNQNSPSSLYNAMIAPLVPFAIKGAIWYQGESNAGKAFEYRTLFPTMISDWRKQWGYDFSFICVQLAPFMKIVSEPTESSWAELREAQYLATVKLPKVGMAVITDLGEENNIHPKKKKPVGERLALAARGIAYEEKIEYSGPIYKSKKIDGNKVILSFDHLGGGLVCKGDKLTGFTICGEDKKFVNAEAVIQGDQIIVSSPKVEKPTEVRFGWANYPVVNLWNKADLPASPFRTDDFPMTTLPKKK